MQTTTGKSFEKQQGTLLQPVEEGWEIPVPIPGKSLPRSADKESLIALLSQAPEHEQVLFALLLQALEFSIEALKQA